MKRESDDSVSRAAFYSPAGSRKPSRDAELQQQEIIDEEERSADALERAGSDIPALEGPMPNDAVALEARGRELAAAIDELRVATEQIRATARAARHVAQEIRVESISICRLRWNE